jgi:hypothetical protein
MSEPVIAVLSVLAAVLVALEQTPIPPPYSTIIRVVAVASAAVVARSQTMPVAKVAAQLEEARKVVPK